MSDSMSSFPVCTVCKKPFKWKGPDPFLLPCLHAVCETCLKSAETSLRCNTCQRDVDLKKTTLQKDRVRQRLILHLTAKHRPTELLCTHENDGSQAVCWCQDCEEFLCEHCQNMHEGFKAMRKHTVTGIGEIACFIEDEAYCTTHKKYVLEFMDHDCDVLICLKCKQGDHTGHSTEDMDTLAKTTRGELQKLVKALYDAKNKTKKQLAENIQKTNEMEKAAASQKDQLILTFHTLKSLVEQRKKEIALEFDNHLENAWSTNSDVRSALSQQLNICLNILEYAKSVLDHASKTDLARITSNIRDRVKECLDSDLYQMKQEQTAITFLNEDLPHLKSSITSFSSTSYSGSKATPGTRNRQPLPCLKLQQKCEALEFEVTTLRETIKNLKSDQKTPAVMEARLIQTLREDLAVKPGATCHLLQPASECIKPFLLHCVKLAFSVEMANQMKVHINEEGELCNQPDPNPTENCKGRLKQYHGTSSSRPLLKADYLQYWETTTSVKLKELLSMNELILEIGVSWKEERDEEVYINCSAHSYSMYGLRCQKHQSICMKVRKEGHDIHCVPDTLPHKQWIPTTLHYGVVYDSTRRKIAFLDLKELKVMAVLGDVDTSQELWPMFGVYNPKRGPISTKLLDGKDITMSTEKKTLILKAMY